MFVDSGYYYVCLRKRVFQSRLLLAFASVVWKPTVHLKEIEIAHPVMLKGLYGNYRCIVRRHPSIVSPLFFRRSVLRNVRGEPRTFDLE